MWPTCHDVEFGSTVSLKTDTHSEHTSEHDGHELQTILIFSRIVEHLSKRNACGRLLMMFNMIVRVFCEWFVLLARARFRNASPVSPIVCICFTMRFLLLARAGPGLSCRALQRPVALRARWRVRIWSAAGGSARSMAAAGSVTGGFGIRSVAATGSVTGASQGQERWSPLESRMPDWEFIFEYECI